MRTSFANTLLSLIFGINVNQLSPQSAKSLQYVEPEMVRLDSFPWDIIEVNKGTYDFTVSDTAMQWAREGKLNVLGIIQYAPGWANGQQFTTPKNISVSNCGIPNLGVSNTLYNKLRTYPPKTYADFGNFVYAIAKRYPDVRYWQIWNEPNNPIFWPTGPNAREYAQLLAVAYRNIKKANPRAQVVLGGISLNDLTYISALYKAAIKDSFDIMAVHLYNPSQSPNAYLAHELETLHQTMVNNHTGDKSIWLTEIGWYTGTAQHSVTEQQQAQYVEQVYTIANSKSYVGAVFWHTLMDCNVGYDPANPEHNYGVFSSDLNPKQAASVMRGIRMH